MSDLERSLGGAERQLATGGDGSSPSAPIKTRNLKVLRRMLRDRDRKLRWYDMYRKKFPEIMTNQAQALDCERKMIREIIKSRRIACGIKGMK